MHGTSQAERTTRALAPRCAQYKFDTMLNSSTAGQRRLGQPAGGGEEDASPVKKGSARLLEQ